MFIKPVNNAKVRNPETYRHVPEYGETTSTHHVYWKRRQAEGVIQILEKQSPKDMALQKKKQAEAKEKADQEAKDAAAAKELADNKAKEAAEAAKKSSDGGNK